MRNNSNNSCNLQNNNDFDNNNTYKCIFLCMSIIIFLFFNEYIKYII